MNTYETVMVIFGGITAIGLPIIGLLISKLDHERGVRQNEMLEHLKHLDECIDKLRNNILSNAITKNEFSDFRVEANETMTRMRSAISIDTNGLHERLMRLEAPFFKGG